MDCLMRTATRLASTRARISCSWEAFNSFAYSRMGRVMVRPWLPLPELITAGSSQPLIRASEPAAAAAMARSFTSGFFSPDSSVRPISAPQLPFRPSWERFWLQEI